jgi:cell division protein FtsW (lipid II flippase)
VFLPCVALLNGLGVAFLRRLDLTSALRDHTSLSPLVGDSIRQIAWTFAAAVVASVALAVVRDHRSLSRYAYTLGLVGIVLVLIPALLPARFSEVNGVKLWIRFGSVFQIQPGEFAKLALLPFFAYYLVRKREVLSLASRRFLGIDFPGSRPGPVLAVLALQPGGSGRREGPGHLAALLRHVRGHPLYRHRAGQLDADSACCCSSVVPSVPISWARRRASTSGWTSG